MKSSGSKTLSALSVLMLFASIFFISCGLPKNPFIVDTVLKLYESSADPISYNIANNVIDFFTEIDTEYTQNGLTLFYFYSNKPYSEIEISKFSDSINSTVYTQNQIINISDADYHIYVFKTNDDNEYSLPTIQITDFISLLPGEVETLYGRLTVNLEDESGENITLYISLFDNESFTTKNFQAELLRFSSLTSTMVNFINPEFGDEVLHETSIASDYYLHLFGSYYVKEPLFEIDHDNIVADTKVTYLGSVKLP